MCKHPLDPRGIGHVGALVLMLLQLGLMGGSLVDELGWMWPRVELGDGRAERGLWPSASCNPCNDLRNVVAVMMCGDLNLGDFSIRSTLVTELAGLSRSGECVIFVTTWQVCSQWRAGVQHGHLRDVTAKTGARYAGGALSACHVWDASWRVRNTRTAINSAISFSAETLQLEEQYTESTSHQFQVKMVSLRELTEQRGNQGREGEEEGVLSVEPITMIVPSELQDVLETTASENSAGSNTSDNGDDHRSASSSSSSTEETPSREEGMGDVVSSVSDRPVIGEWESTTIPGRLSNLRKAPKDLPAGFRFRAALHHEVADCTPSISGYKRLEEMVRAYHIPKTILLRTGGKNERACTVSQTGWIPVYADHFDAGLRFPLPGLVFDLLAEYELALTQLTPNNIRFIIGFMLLCARLEMPAKAIVFRSLFQCWLCPNSRGAKWYYLSGRDKSQLFKNVRNKVARWKRQFIFVRDARAERINNDLAARLSEWRMPNAHINYPQLLPRNVDLKNQLLQYAQGEGLIDLEALVTSEQLAVFGFVDVTNLFSEASTCPELMRSWDGRQLAETDAVLEDGEDPTGLPSFDAWVEGAPVAEQEPSTTPPSSQPAVVPISSPASASIPEPAGQSPPARSPAAAADASMPVDLTDD
ncbi:hypothetical protein SLEP1_g56798 [Rubroshorea leprosula]|uniref:Transposase (putative) gypsy type domain-containing protein n=1 Tax=Rubroshorea leprosula TaxID=152421 RepID=A0AAV5MMT0_9ROSI|nr:hypothetical protein SLEP1_g56798 [Rubroshorea leprosula]